MSWKTDRTNQFRKCYKNASSEIQSRVKAAIVQLVEEKDPRVLGVGKQGQLAGVWAYEIGRNCRLLYSLDWDSHTLLFDRICDHNVAYSKR